MIRFFFDIKTYIYGIKLKNYEKFITSIIIII